MAFKYDFLYLQGLVMIAWRLLVTYTQLIFLLIIIIEQIQEVEEVIDIRIIAERVWHTLFTEVQSYRN